MVATLLTALTLGLAPVTPVEDPECAMPTGVAGELAVTTSIGERYEVPREGVEFWSARRSGLVAGEFVELGDGYGCISVARRASGAGIAAGQDSSDSLNAVVRDPGGGYWSAPAVVAAASGDDWRPSRDSAVAVSDRGDAVVAWTDSRYASSGSASRIWMARRSPGGRFEAPMLLAGPGELDDRALEAGVAATGEAFVLWTEPVDESSHRVMLATAAPGSAPTIAEVGRQSWASRPALAVAPDGRALVALPERDGLAVIERGPGEPFGPPVPLAATRDGVGTRASAALGPGGEAIVTWSGFSVGGVEAATRRGPGTFDPPRTLARGNAAPPFDPYLSSYGFQLALAPDAYDFGGADPEATMTGDGRALVSWNSRRDGLEYADVAAVALNGSPAVAGSALIAEQYPQSVTGLTLPDGAPAVAWLGGPLSEELRLAAPGAGGGADPPLPRLRVGRPARRVLGPEDPLVLPVRCSRACEVRGRIPALRVDESAWLHSAGSDKLELRPIALPIAPRRAGRVRVELTFRAAGGRRVGRRTVSVRLERTKTPPDPRAVGLRAERVGDAVRVRWRTDRPARSSVFYVTGAAERVLRGEPPAAQNIVARDGRRSFSVTLRPPAGVAWITLHTRTRDTMGLRTQRIAVP